VPLTRIFRLVRKGEVRVNGGRATPEQRLAEGDRVRVPPVRAQSATEVVREATGRTPVPPRLMERVQAAIIHEDDRLLVIDKPSGLAVHGGSGLDFGVIEALRAARPDETLELAHRLDRDTSGLLLVARKRSALRELHAMLREGGMEKTYLALVVGRWELGKKLVDAPLHTEGRVSGERTVRVGAGGKAARTEFRLVQQFGPRASLLEATLDTGRTHQIRVHAAWCRHPVAGDSKYGDAKANAAFRAVGLNRLFLHAHSLSFTWPGGASMAFSSPLPADLKAVIDALQDGKGPALRVAPGPDHVPPVPGVVRTPFVPFRPRGESPARGGRRRPPARASADRPVRARRDDVRGAPDRTAPPGAPAGRRMPGRKGVGGRPPGGSSRAGSRAGSRPGAAAGPRTGAGPRSGVRAGGSRRPGGSRPGGSGGARRGRSGPR
jgi:23S rRNA pseudouridine955/2504/2580 synthase